MKTTKIITLIIALTTSTISYAYNNETIESFRKSKKLLLGKIYFDHRKTIYCGAKFNMKKAITNYNGYTGNKYAKRSKRIEWEHVVPAHNFGRTFQSWRNGDKQCVNNQGNLYKGRRCANKASKEYRLMQADMYNLFPAIGSVNAHRSNFNFVMMPEEKSDFGACDMRIENRKAQPPVRSRGRIARTYLYMDDAYSRYTMSEAQRKLMEFWDRQYPVSRWECKRNKRIEAIQGNTNNILKSRCALRDWQ